MAQADVRQYEVQARSTATFGRVLCSSRNHHFVVDGPVGNGCPGEEITPAELFLAGIAACGVELLEVIARERNLPLEAANVSIQGVMDRSRPVRPDLTVFNTVRLEFRLRGVAEEQGTELVDVFKGR
jgi:uncharacterized OsmC-like protein